MATDLQSASHTSRRVLIVRIGAMGDVLHALPAVSALRRLHPDWEIDWAVDPRWAPLLGTAAVDQLHLVPTRAWKQRPLSLDTVRQILRLKDELRSRAYDLCVDLQGTIRSAVVGRMAGAARFVGPEEPRERLACLLYRERIPATEVHVIDQACDLLGAAVGERLGPAAVALPVDAAAEAWCSATLERILFSGGQQRPFLVMAPTAGWGAKQWPPERFGAVAAALAQHGYVTLINSAGKGDVASGDGDVVATKVAAASGGSAHVVTCGIAQLVSLLRRASLLIGGDTGPLHLAAALGRPVVGLYGPTDPARNGPYTAAARVLRHPSSRHDYHRHAETEAGLLQIATEQVVSAALDLLRPSTSTLETA